VANNKNEGSPALLFERLVDDQPHVPSEPQPLRVLTKEQLVASIRHELLRLLNTRTSTFEKPPYGWTVLDYGLPDFSAMYPADARERDVLSKRIATAIMSYEPRLHNVRVTAAVEAGSEKGLEIRIEGMLVWGNVTEPVSFPLVSESGDWTDGNGG
jgi:type VI secretion system lysozyme-like protein